jgi:hypothetical protein
MRVKRQDISNLQLIMAMLKVSTIQKAITTRILGYQLILRMQRNIFKKGRIEEFQTVK